MGIFDFFKKGKEEPARRTPDKPATNTPRPSTPASATPSPTAREHIIRPGESLSKIAQQYYGNAGQWQKIYQANKDRIKDPNLIHPGQKIVIP